MALTAIIPFHACDEYRVRNLRAVVERLQADRLVKAIIIVEQGSTRSNQIAFPEKSVSRISVASDGPFNKSRCVNRGVMASTTDRLLISDADMLLDSDTIARAADVLGGQLDLIRPWQYLIDLDDTQSTRFIADGVLPERPPAERGFNRDYEGERLCVAGGAFLIRRDFYIALGGFDEGFAGWGGEDDAFAFVAESRSSKTAISRNALAWHLWHPRSRGVNDPAYQDNLRRLGQIRSMEPAAIADYAQRRSDQLQSEPEADWR